MNPLVISCHTPDHLYQTSANRLRASLDRFNLDHEIQSYQSRGTWKDNTCYKPFFIKAMLEKYPGRPLWWLDADAEVVAFPQLFFKQEADFAAGYKGQEFLAGTLYFANNEWSLKIVNDWIDHLKLPEALPWKEQLALAAVVKYLREQKCIIFQELPFEYVRIFDVPHERETVVLHHQLSRQGREFYGT